MTYGVIYALVDPKTGEWRYIGQTTQPLHHRLVRHVRDARKGDYYLHRWIRKLGQSPHALLVEECDDQDSLDRAETEWIDGLRALGYSLTNIREGGCGGKLSRETRRKLSAAKRGVPKPPGFAAQVSQSLRGRPKSAEHRAAMLRSWQPGGARRRAYEASHA